MKLRLKFSDGRTNYSFCEDDEKLQNYGQLREEIAAVLSPGKSFDLSLNYGKDLIKVDDDSLLKDLSIVSGDMLTVVLHEDISDVVTSAESTMETEMQISPDQKTVNGYMHEIVLCRESEPGAIPSTLEILYRTQPVESKLDALILVIHRLMNEVGFVQAEVGSSLQLLSSWKIMNGVYKMKYLDSACPLHNCQLVCVAFDNNTLVVNAMICDGLSKDTIMNMTIQCDKYVNFCPTVKSEPKHVYRDLPHLSRCFKDSIAQPLQNTIHNDAEIPVTCNFVTLPMELKQIILSYLNHRDLLKMSEVCVELNVLCNENHIWKKCFARMFPYQKSNCPSTLTWKEKYIETYKEERKRKQSSRLPHHLTCRFPPMVMKPHHHLHRNIFRRRLVDDTPYGFPQFI